MSDTTTNAPLPCNVLHPDAGGPCHRPATMEVYGLRFCEAHGTDAKLGAASQAAHEVWCFFARFQNETVLGFGEAIDREITAALRRVQENSPTCDELTQAMLRAYPEATEEVRRHIEFDSEDEPGKPTFYDDAMDSLNTLHECMGIAYRDGATWLLEMLELERESVAAHAAEALRASQQRRAEGGARPA